MCSRCMRSSSSCSDLCTPVAFLWARTHMCSLHLEHQTRTPAGRLSTLGFMTAQQKPSFEVNLQMTLTPQLASSPRLSCLSQMIILPGSLAGRLLPSFFLSWHLISYQPVSPVSASLNPQQFLPGPGSEVPTSQSLPFRFIFHSSNRIAIP